MPIIKKSTLLFSTGTMGIRGKCFKWQCNDRFGIVWAGINRPRNICFICSHLREGIAIFLLQAEFVVVAVLCFVVVVFAVVFLHQLVYFCTCSSSIVHTTPYKNRSLSVPFACY